MRRIGRVLVAAPLAVALLWAAAALSVDGPAARPVAGGLAAAVLLVGFAALLRVRPFALGALVAALPAVAVAAWWLRVPPSNDRDWQPDVARLPRAHIEGDFVTFENVRNFDYRSESDYAERWETRRVDLRRITGIDLYLVTWGSPHIAHTITSWRFEDAPPLAISIETRKEKGESYSAVLGFFHQYELYYVVADERDVVRLRTNHRGERARLYRIRMPIDQARALLVDYAREIERLARAPRWYNAATHNCTTAIRWHVGRVRGARALDWRVMLNGHLDELLYANGDIDTSLPFDELRARSDVTGRAQAADADPEFWRRIREGTPGFGALAAASAAETRP